MCAGGWWNWEVKGWWEGCRQEPLCAGLGDTRTAAHPSVRLETLRALL